MPSTDAGRKLTPAEQATAEAAIEAAPKDTWLITRRPLHPGRPGGTRPSSRPPAGPR